MTAPSPEVDSHERLTVLARTYKPAEHIAVVSVSCRCRRILGQGNSVPELLGLALERLGSVARISELFQHDRLSKPLSNREMRSKILLRHAVCHAYAVGECILGHPSPHQRPDMHVEIIEVLMSMDLLEKFHVYLAAIKSLTA